MKDGDTSTVDGNQMTDAELDVLLERFDQTEPRLQRRIVGSLMENVAGAMARIAALEALLSRKNAALAVFADVRNWSHRYELAYWNSEKHCQPVAFAARERDATEANHE